MLYFLYVLLLPGNDAIGQSHYECGQHGRFEYCIDDIPGCVVGCHCYPGYYFDTETKICEPNTKLVQEYRRVFGDMVPTRKFLGEYHDRNHTIDGIELQVENITNNQTDELGDWLYNQFFKAIESQALNNSIDTVTVKPGSRRSGDSKPKGTNKDGQSDKKKSKRKAHSKKKLEKKLKKLKKKKHDPRRRLLRISEDDSLFETSDSHGDDDDDDDSDSGSSDSSETESTETESSSGSYSSEETDKEEKQNHDKHADHGHESVLYFNKKNKPPLPSFIFLPQSMNTPYFPPIGLPALSPPIPLYPMIPVPPLMPFPSDCNGNYTSTTTTTTSTTTTTTTTTETTTTTTTEKPLLRQPPPMPLPPIPPPMIPPVKKNFKWSKRRRKPMVRPRIPPMSASIAPQKKKPPAPTIPETLPTMPETIPTIPETVPPIPEAMPPLPNFEPPPVEDVPVPYPEFPVQPMPVIRAHNSPEPENVDFKYLAQLIHKMDNSNSNQSNQINVPAGGDEKKEINMPVSVRQPSKDSRRIMNSDLQRNLNTRTEDENYYTKLGHEIAALIRQIDTTGGRRVNIEIERRIRDQDLPAQPVFSEYSYSPRSYWDRSVRSLLKHFPTYTDEIFPRKVQEESLFNLENKVETVATTMSTLSLRDIENVIFLIDKTKAQLSMRLNNTNHHNVDYKTGNLNINLLPRPELHRESSEKRIENVFFQNSTIFVNELNKINGPEDIHNDTETRRSYDSEKDINDLRGIFLRNIRKLRPDKMEPYNYDSRITNNSVQISENENEIAHFQRIAGAQLKEAAKRRRLPPRTPWLVANLANMIEAHNFHDLKQTHLPNFAVETYRSKPHNIKLQITPNEINLPKLPAIYGDKINRHYHHKGLQIPIHTAIKRKKFGANSIGPTYFLHEFKHLDFFDPSL